MTPPRGIEDASASAGGSALCSHSQSAIRNSKCLSRCLLPTAYCFLVFHNLQSSICNLKCSSFRPPPSALCLLPSRFFSGLHSAIFNPRSAIVSLPSAFCHLPSALPNLQSSICNLKCSSFRPLPSALCLLLFTLPVPPLPISPAPPLPSPSAPLPSARCLLPPAVGFPSAASRFTFHALIPQSAFGNRDAFPRFSLSVGSTQTFQSYRRARGGRRGRPDIPWEFRNNTFFRVRTLFPQPRRSKDLSRLALRPRRSLR